MVCAPRAGAISKRIVTARQDFSREQEPRPSQFLQAKPGTADQIGAGQTKAEETGL
jgi:hypothetical protein